MPNGFREKVITSQSKRQETVPPDGIACDLVSLSPKLGNSTPLPGEIEEGWIKRHEERRLQPEILRQWIDSYPFQLKFVVSDASQLLEKSSN